MALYSSYISLWSLSLYVCIVKEHIFSSNSKGTHDLFYSGLIRLLYNESIFLHYVCIHL